MKSSLFKLCALALALNQIEHRVSGGAEFGTANSIAITEREKAANAQRDALKQRAQNILIANKVHPQRLPLPPCGFWLIDLSFHRANRDTVEAVHSLLGEDPGWVRLPHNKLGSDEIKTLAKSRGIFHLDLSDTSVGDSDLIEIGMLTKLTELSLNGNDISDEGLVHLTALRELRRLKLDRTKIKGPGLKHLAALTQLIELRLNSTGVGDKDLEHLAGLHHLESLDVARTSVTNDGARQFMELQYQARKNAIQRGAITVERDVPLQVIRDGRQGDR